MRFSSARFSHGARGRSAVLAVLAGSAWMLACSKPKDTISQAEKAPDAGPGPLIAETKAIAEEGFIYGLPIVMNYAVMYEYAVDRSSGQYKAPFNQINNEARVFTYKDTAIVTPNSDTPYSFVWMDLRAEPMVLSVPAVEKERYYSVQLVRRQHVQLRLHRQPRHRQRSRRLHGRRPGLEGRDPAGIKKVFRSTTQFSLAIFRTQLFNAGRHAQRGQGSGRLQGAAALRLSSSSRRRPPRRHRLSRRSTRRS